MWTTIYVASDKKWALEIEGKLRDEGFIVKSKHFSSEDQDELYEILVPDFEAGDVQEFLIDQGII